MEFHSEPVQGQLLNSATVVMLRDSVAGLEVFLLKRHSHSDVLGGAYVFPGGKLDPEDALPSTLVRLDQDLAALHHALGEADLQPETSASLFVAAVREAFEETGVLFAHGVQDSEAQQAWARHHQGHSFDNVLSQMDRRMLASCMAPWSRWVTPLIGGVLRKRFDTRFFVAPMPAGQLARHDNHEAVDSIWLSPRAALEQYRDELIDLAPPQIMTLAHLSRHGAVASVMAEARERQPPLIRPEAFQQDGMRVLCYPGDDRHSVPTRALPGPTRLCHNGHRFVPAGGFDELFS